MDQFSNWVRITKNKDKHLLYKDEIINVNQWLFDLITILIASLPSGIIFNTIQGVNNYFVTFNLYLRFQNCTRLWISKKYKKLSWELRLVLPGCLVMKFYQTRMQYICLYPLVKSDVLMSWKHIHTAYQMLTLYLLLFLWRLKDLILFT